MENVHTKKVRIKNWLFEAKNKSQGWKCDRNWINFFVIRKKSTESFQKFCEQQLS